MSGYTHLFNAMSGLQSRAPGAVGAALSSEHAYFGVIADGHHVHPASLKIAALARPDHMILVTDAMPSVGANTDSFTLGNDTIYVADGRCQNAQGTLAGSDLCMQDAVKNIQAFAGISQPHALQMASLHPSKVLGLDNQLGKIAPGYRASFTILDSQQHAVSTMIDGVLYSGSEH